MGRPYVSLLCKAASTFLHRRRPRVVRLRGPGPHRCVLLSGGQIDGQGNINLVSIGDYEHPKVRFPGSFGSAYLYYVVPKVILFRTEHSRRTLVPKVDFISAPGSSDGQCLSDRRADCVSDQPLRCSDLPRRRFTLASVHPATRSTKSSNTPGSSSIGRRGAGTPAPTPETLKMMREAVAPQLAEVYPQFAAQVFGVGQPAFAR